MQCSICCPRLLWLRMASKIMKRNNSNGTKQEREISQITRQWEFQVKKAISVTRLDSASLIWLASINICPRLYRIGETALLTSPSSIVEIPGSRDTAPTRSCEVLRDSVPTTLRPRLENDFFIVSSLEG